MFNRYVPSSLPWPTDEKDLSRPAGEIKKTGIDSLFGGKLKVPRLNADTVLLLVIAYFLVADPGDEKPRPEILVILGILLILGF